MALHFVGALRLPFEADADRRHRIPNQRHRVADRAAYDAALRQRGSLTVGFTDAEIAAWVAEPCTTPGGVLSGLAPTGLFGRRGMARRLRDQWGLGLRWALLQGSAGGVP